MNFATESDIGVIATGVIPVRKNPKRAYMPKDGTNQNDDWQGFIPWKDQPRIINPNKGYVIDANNKIAPDEIKWSPTLNMWTTPRAVRINEVIKQKIDSGQKISPEFMR